MRLTPLSQGTNATAIRAQDPVKGPFVPGAETGGLQKIRHQSHREAAKGLSVGLPWRNAKTLGLGPLAQGLLRGVGWLFKGMGAMVGRLSNHALAHGDRLHRQEKPDKYQQGLGYAAKGLGYILKAPELLMKGLGAMASLVARPAGQVTSGLEKMGYLAFKGMGKAVMSVATKGVAAQSPAQPEANASLKDAIHRLAQGGHRIEPQQISELALHLADPDKHAWPAGLDPSIKALIASPAH